MVAGRFLMKPDFQLRDVGASVPSVSFSLNTSLSCSRHPVMVTGLDTTAFAEPCLGADPFVSTCDTGLATGVSSAGATIFDVIAGDTPGSGRRAASIIAAAPISTTSTTPTVRSMRTLSECFPRGAFFAAVIRFLTLLKSIDVLPRYRLRQRAGESRQSGVPADRFRRHTASADCFGRWMEREQAGCPGHNCATAVCKAAWGRELTE